MKKRLDEAVSGWAGRVCLVGIGANVAELYRKKVAKLHSLLTDETTRHQAMDINCSQRSFCALWARPAIDIGHQEKPGPPFPETVPGRIQQLVQRSGTERVAAATMLLRRPRGWERVN